MDLTRLSVQEGSLSPWSYCYSCGLPGLVNERMKFHLVIFLAAALLQRISAQCPNECSSFFKGKLVCAFSIINGCHLDMEYCSLMAFNCGRLVLMKPLFLVLSADSCGEDKFPKCQTVDF